MISFNDISKLFSYDLEGKFCIEIWKYEPVGSSNKFVDKLSLALSLQDDIDPRVNKEVEQLIENIW